MAAPPVAVKVLDFCRVAPPPTSPDSAPSGTSLPLTFFDVLWLRFPPTQRLFFYGASLPNATFFETVLPKLKRSLSITLQYFLPLAGKVTWPTDSDKPIIQYLEGDAVSLTVAESEADFRHLSGYNVSEAAEFHPLLPDIPATDTQVPAMALQVTLFPNTGFSIGYSVHHAVLDGKTIVMFMHSWASICRRGGDRETALPPELTPCYDRTAIKDPTDLARIYLDAWLGLNGPNKRSLVMVDLKPPPDSIRGTFELNRSNIDRIKRWVLARFQENHEGESSIHLSTFTVTVAYVWTCMVKSRELKNEKVHLAFTIDCRARLDPPVASNYFGNCISGRVVHADRNELAGEHGVAVAAKAIGEAVGGLSNGVLEDAENLMKRLFSLSGQEVCSIAGSPRFEVYKTDFGWGRPKKVEMVSIDVSGAFSLSESRDGHGGVEIGVVLKKHEIEAFASLFASGLQHH